MNLNKIILEPSVTKKGIYGLQYCQNGLIFFKDNIKYLEDDQDFFKKSEFSYSPVLLIDKDEHTSYYEFDEDLYCNTLYDTLYFGGRYWHFRRRWFKTLEKGMSINYKLMNMNDTNSKKFFIDRVELIKKSFKYTNYEFILEDVYNFIKGIDRYSFRTYISNGDLTDTNICLNNKICDTECFGYNVVICDLAIFFISILFGRWIYPKYNSQAYKFRKNKIIKAEFKISRRQLDILNRIMKLVKPIEFEYFKKLLIMRLVTPISMEDIEEHDRIKIDEIMLVISLSNINNLVKNLYELQKSA